MKVSVNILCWNNMDVIPHLLTMVSNELKDIEHEIIFVDNGSNDGSLDFIKELKQYKEYVNLKIISNEKNMGISIGKNQGIDASSGEYIFMVDGDVVPVPNSILLMMKWLDENKDKHAIGAYPNKFCDQMNKGHLSPCESFCNVLHEPVEHKCACLFYGMYRKSIFDDGLRMNEEGEFGKPGYGWEDHDFFLRMKERGIIQYVAHINNPRGRYYHKINSSIRVMGEDAFRSSMSARSKQFKGIWDAVR